jgi:hypothetical protein
MLLSLTPRFIEVVEGEGREMLLSLTPRFIEVVEWEGREYNCFNSFRFLVNR